MPKHLRLDAWTGPRQIRVGETPTQDFPESVSDFRTLCEVTRDAPSGPRNGLPNTTRRQVMNPPAKAEAGNLANTAPRQLDHDGACRGFDRYVIVAGGAARNCHRAFVRGNPTPADRTESA